MGPKMPITPKYLMKRFFSHMEWNMPGAVLWLMSPASAFVTGIVIPIDGGFSAYSGV